MHRPREVVERLGISHTTLRRWCAAFADHLSPTAGSAIAESGHPAQRRFTDTDLALLAAIQRELAAKRTMDEIHIRLQRGLITPDTGVVDHDNTAEPRQLASTEPTTVEALALVGGSSAEMQAALLALIQSAPAITDALAQVEATTRALQETAAAQQTLLAELRAERASLDAARAEMQAIRDSPLVPIPAHDPPQAPVTGWRRVMRLFTEGR